MKLQLAPGEVVLKVGRADRILSALAYIRGGYLWLTNRRLVYQLHAFVKVTEETFPLDQIVSAQAIAVIGLIFKGMSITLLDGRELKYYVLGREDWLARIAAARSAPALPAAPAVDNAAPAPGQPRVATHRSIQDFSLLAIAAMALAVFFFILSMGVCMFLYAGLH